MRSWILGLLGLLVIQCTANAASPLQEINPKWLKDLPLSFEIQSTRLPNGDIQFSVKVMERKFKFSDQWITSLSKVHITEGTQESRRDRNLPAERNGNAITCVFVVTDLELKDPDLSFYFGMWDSTARIAGREHFYAPLKNFLP